MSSICKAYAIRAGGVIDLATVSPTEEGAKVNWLCTARGFMPLEMHRGEFVRNLFAEHADRAKNVECIAVEVRPHDRYAGSERPTDRFTEAPERACHDDPLMAHRGFVRQEMAGMAAKIEELVDRLDGVERRVVAQNQGLNDAVGAINLHDDRIGSWGVRIDSLYGRIGKMDEEHAREIEQINQRLQGATTIAELLARIRKLESQTYEQEKVLNGFFPSQVDTGSYAPPRKSLGWINVYVGNPNRPTFISNAHYETREEADKGSVAGRIACIEIFEGDGL